MEEVMAALLILGTTLLSIFLYALILGLPIMLLWDAIMPDIFGLGEITFWQAVGLGILSGCLFKNNINISK